jgi:hypothetical protein
MTDRFVVEEVCVVNYPGSWFDGREVTVTHDLFLCGWMDIQTGERFGPELVYGIHFAPDPRVQISAPRFLRKRRPPQDWVRICRLSERPVEEPA